MKFSISVKPNAREEGVMQSGAELIVRTREPARDGRANAAVIRLLAQHFKVPKSSISIVHGQGGRKKIVEIEGRP